MILSAGPMRRKRRLPLFLAALLLTTSFAATLLASSASAGTWQGTLGIDWDQTSAGSLGNHEQFDGQVTVTGSEDSTHFWDLYGPFNATWSDYFYGDENNEPCTASGSIISPEFVPNPGTTDQFLRFENLQPDAPVFNPRAGTYTLTNFHVMIDASGCGYEYGPEDYQWHPEQPELNLTLPTQGERGPQIEAGGKLHWTGQQSLATTVFDTSYTAVWTYDLTYDPGGGLPCQLTAAIPQKVATALKVGVVGGSEGCLAKITSIKYKVGGRVFTYIRRKPQKRVAAGETWRLAFPITGDFRTIVVRALRAKKTVLGKVTADLDGASDAIIVPIR